MLRKCIILLTLGLLVASPASARSYANGTMMVSPSVFVLEHEGSCLTVHTELLFSDVDRHSLRLFGDGGTSITPYYVKSDLRGNVVAKFRADDVRMIVGPPSSELRLEGYFEDGAYFSLYAIISVR